MVKRFETCLIWLQLAFCCILTMGIICSAILFPDSENKVIRFLLKHVTIQAVVEDDHWSEEYPFNETVMEHYLSRVNSVKSSIDNYCTASFPGSGLIDMAVSSYKENIIQYRVSGIPCIDDSKAYISESAENVIEFKNDVNSLGIPFFYVQTPSKGGIDYYNNVAVEGDSLTIAERSFCLTTTLENSGVDIVNIARDYSDGIEFDSSAHWMPKDGLNCAKLISEKLNNEYGFDIDIKVFDEENLYDLMANYPEESAAITGNFGYEFKLPCPDYPTTYSIVYAENTEFNGSFENVIFRPNEDWDTEGVAYHDVFRISNSLFNEIYNSDAICKKKVLIIGDSFNWPVASYLSLGCEYVTVIHNASFTGSLISYIETNKPDIVIMVYNDAEFYEIYTQDAYYLK